MYDSKTYSIDLQENLDRAILYGLSCEWDNALWVLDHPERQKLKKPLFSLKDMGRQLGSWSSERNEISLSRKLVLNYHWDDIREILLHEMAHQYADQILIAGKERPHGRLFQKACFLLRANPKASGIFSPLHDRMRQQPQSPRDRNLIRIRKLMSLAKSKNRHEAEAAMAKAHDLMKKYNFDLMSKSRSRDFVSVFVGPPALRHHRESYCLANLLQEYYFVQGLWVSAYVLEKGKMGRVLEISGTIQNLKIATYVHAFVNHYIDSQWHVYSSGKHLNRYRKSDFSVGLIEGFRNKLKTREYAKKKENTPSPYALVKLKDPLLEDYMTYRYPNTQSFRRKVASQDDGILQDGFRIGENMVISKGISHKKASAGPQGPELIPE